MNITITKARCSRAASLAGLVFGIAVSLAASPASAVTVTIHNADSAGEGFNDQTPVAPVGRNPGTTLGAQRLFAFQYAADTWGRHLDGDIPVVVRATFDSLGGSAVSAVLGFTRTTTVHRDFTGAPATQTWYPSALANELNGTDLNNAAPEACPDPLVEGKCPEIIAQFNTSVDNQTVLGAVDFYYGLDGVSGNDIDFQSIALHELAHGLGLLDQLDPATGEEYFGFDDAYEKNLEDATVSPKKLTAMSDLQRKQALVHDGKLVWAGAAVKAASGGLSAGRRDDGAIQIYAPATYANGSSTTHVDTDLTPNELMEPFIVSSEPRGTSLTLAMLDDLGWTALFFTECGDANENGVVNSSDALAVLKNAVDPEPDCPLTICDANLSGDLSAADALLVLKFAVGQAVLLTCPIP